MVPEILRAGGSPGPLNSKKKPGQNRVKIATRIGQFSQYLRTDILFKIAKSVEVVIMSRKTAILP